MINYSYFRHAFWCASMCIFFSTHAATLYVENVLDNGSPGSLRTTIENAASGDTILFNVSGTILLDGTKGELVIDKSLTIDGEEKIIIDGQNNITTCLHVLAGDYDVNFLSLTIQHFSDEGGTGSEDVYGILVEDTVTQCTVHNCTIQKLTSTSLAPAAVTGISAISNKMTITNNVVTELTRGTNPEYTEGNVDGIGLIAVEGTCSNNTVFNCQSGASNQSSGILTGIRVDDLNSRTIRWLCSNNKVYNCQTGCANVASGLIRGIRHINPSSTVHCSDNQIHNCKSGKSDIESGSTIGMDVGLMQGACVRNTVCNCMSGISKQQSGNATGIGIFFGEGLCSDNSVSTIASGAARELSGFARGIEIGIRRPVAGPITCARNKIYNILTGEAAESRFAIGISNEQSNCPFDNNPFNFIHNSIDTVCAGNATVRGAAQGIIQDIACTNSMVRCNTITNLSGGTSLFSRGYLSGVVGINSAGGDTITIEGNIISDLTGESGNFTAGIQCGNISTTGTVFSVTNSTISHNTIKNITAQDSGFGIAVLTEGSFGNSLLSNSISGTSGKAISIVDNIVDGEDLSAIVDAFVTLSSATCIGGKKIRVTGVVEPQTGLLGMPFLLQFFVSNTNTPSQAKTLIFEQLIETPEGSVFDITFAPAVTTSFGQYISATATAQVEQPGVNWNTSEVSDGIPACNSAGIPYLNLVCPANSTPLVPFNCDSLLNCSLEDDENDSSIL